MRERAWQSEEAMKRGKSKEVRSATYSLANKDKASNREEVKPFNYEAVCRHTARVGSEMLED